MAHTPPVGQVRLRRPTALRIVELIALSISIGGGLKALLPALACNALCRANPTLLAFRGSHADIQLLNCCWYWAVLS